MLCISTDLVARSGHRMIVDHSNLYCWGGYNPHYWEVENTEDTEYPLFKEVHYKSVPMQLYRFLALLELKFFIEKKKKMKF